ncbi:MAG TPA: hypothetical protein VFQ53_08400 [Kofleriaceae bacterium]|nr:hypothetical protein [Kofleriaceae bacterium]
MVIDEEAIAGELHVAAAPRASTWGPHARAVLAIGVRAGLVPSLIVFALYFLTNRDAELPWVRVATLVAAYGPAVGVLLAGSIALVVAVTDRIARLGHGLVVIANPITAGAVAGLVAGIAPGAIGVSMFGAYHGPFVGTALIAFGMIAGSVLVAAPLALRARRARASVADKRAVALATVFATLILCAVAAVLAPVIVGNAFEEARGGLDEYGAIVGAVAGAAGGAVIGVFIGLVIALGRSIGITAPGAPTARTGGSRVHR